jgi:hypothetical protein
MNSTLLTLFYTPSDWVTTNHALAFTEQNPIFATENQLFAYFPNFLS